MGKGFYSYIIMKFSILCPSRSRPTQLLRLINSLTTHTKHLDDIELLINAGFTIRGGKANPFVRDRVNAMNKAFYDKKYFVNTHNCPEYTEALEKIAYLNNEPDKHSGLYHITDAGGYFCYNVNKKSCTI